MDGQGKNSSRGDCGKRSLHHLFSVIIGIVYGRIRYAGLTVRGTGPDITAIRLSVLAALLTNW